MSRSIRKFGEFLTLWFGQLKQGYFPKHQKLSSADGLVDVGLNYPLSSRIRELPLFVTGLGICQEEAIVIRSSQFREHFQNQVIEKLQYRDLCHIESDTLKHLHCLVLRIEHEKQSYQQTQDSQKQATIQLNDCPLWNRNNLSLSEPFGEAVYNDATQSKQEQRPIENPLLPLCQKSNSEYRSCPLLYHKDSVQGSPK